MIEENIIIRKVIVKSRSIEEALGATGIKAIGYQLFPSMVKEFCSQLITKPKPTDEEVEVHFFPWDCEIGVDKSYELQGLVPADPYTVCAVNEADPDFAFAYDHCTKWDNGEKRESFLVFHGVPCASIRSFMISNDHIGWVSYLAGVRPS